MYIYTILDLESVRIYDHFMLQLSIIPEVPVEIVTSHASEYDFQPASETASGESNSDTFVPNGNGKRTKRPKQKPQMAIVPITIKVSLLLLANLVFSLWVTSQWA